MTEDSLNPPSTTIDHRAHMTRILREIDLMMDYATSRGIAIDGDLQRQVSRLSVDQPSSERPETLDATTSKPSRTEDPIVSRLRSALKSHGELSRLVAPATPTSISATAPAAPGSWRIRNRTNTYLIYATLTALGVYLLTSALLALTEPVPKDAGPKAPTIAATPSTQDQIFEESPGEEEEVEEQTQ